MKLYTYAGAPNPRRVHIFLAEKGLAIPFESVDIMKRENRTPEFLEKVNALGGLPVLELDDGTHIAESVAICRYLELENPSPALFGESALEQARVEMWIRRVELNFMMPLGLVWIHGSPLTRGVIKEQIPAVAEQNRVVVRNFYRFLDRHFEGREFLALDTYSMADILALCTLDFAAKLNDLPHSAEQVELDRWHRAVSARPSASA